MTVVLADGKVLIALTVVESIRAQRWHHFWSDAVATVS